MQKLAEICVRRPVFTWVLVLSLVVVGLFAFVLMFVIVVMLGIHVMFRRDRRGHFVVRQRIVVVFDRVQLVEVRHAVESAGRRGLVEVRQVDRVRHCAAAF